MRIYTYFKTIITQIQKIKKSQLFPDWLHSVSSKGKTSNFLMEDFEQIQQFEVIDFYMDMK